MRCSASTRGLRELHREPAGAEVAPELLAKQHLDVRFVVDHEDEQGHACPPDLGERCGAARQHDAELGELAGLRLDLDRAGMLLHDDVVAERQAKPGAFAGRLGREEGIEHLLLHLRRNAGAVVADPDLDAVAEVPGRGRQRRLVGAVVASASRLIGCVEAVRDQVEEHPRDLLRVEVDLAGRRDRRICSSVMLKPCFSARAP